MSEELKPCPFCKSIRITRLLNFDVDKGYSETIYCEECGAEVHNPLVNWNIRPIEDEKDKEIDSLKVELDNLRHFCDSILEMAKRNNGVLYFKQDSGTWKIETGKDTDIPANDTNNNGWSMEKE